MTIRDEYENLKSELVVKLTETTVLCNLVFPFNFTITQEEEDEYLMEGLETRRATQRAMLIIDNAYKKCWLLPSNETAKDFSKIQSEILNDYKKKVLKAFETEAWRYKNQTKETFTKYIEDLIKKIKEASKPYVEKLKTMTHEEVEKAIEEKYSTKLPIEVYKLN